MIKTKKQVIIGLSGGIDSATAAYRLKNEGYEVIGVTFNFFNEEKMLKTAAEVADQLGISHLVINAQSRFRKNVIEPFIDGYKSGRTPNPCMFCNQRLKFKLLLETAADYHNAKIATGHYAEIQKVGKFYRLLASKNKTKDQSYFLYHLNQSILSRLILPLNSFESKAEVRGMLLGVLPDIARGPESQGICFIPKGNHTLFLKEAIFGSQPVPKGNFLDSHGKILGKHPGSHGFTLGQTRKLGIENPNHLAVVDIISETNVVILDDESALFKSKILIDELALNLKKEQFSNGFTFRTCCWGTSHSGTIEWLPKGQAVVHSTVPVRAPAPGQALVFYEDRHVLGGGIIKKF